MKSCRKNLVYFFTLALLAGCCNSAFAQEWERILNLRGYWKFSIGDDMKWALPNFDDSEWEEIKVPAYWEEEGFNGYNGYAWYRKTFQMPAGVDNSTIYLDLGTVDDIDQTFVNGNLIGHSGSFPPNYETAYFANRRYPIPAKFLKPGQKNVIAVRVYDAEQGGGINSGKIGLYILPYSLDPDLSFEGEWRFKTGDDLNWKDPKLNDRNWDKIIVPQYWESQGYKDYDGYAWYRYTFRAPAYLKGKELVLLLGRIDDMDQAYVNGQFVGQTGKFRNGSPKLGHSNEYQQFRGYYLPDGLLKVNEDNVIAVRVYDDYRDGGIYQGPIGLITQDKYTKFWRHERNKPKNIFEQWFNNE